LKALKRWNKKISHSKKATAIQTSLWPIGASISSLVGGYLAEINFRIPIFVTIIGLSIALTIQFFLVETLQNSRNKKNSIFDKSIIQGAYNTIKSSKNLKILFFVGFLSYSFGEVAHQLKPVYFDFKNIEIRYFGLLFAFTFGLSFLGSISSDKFSGLLGEKRALIISSVLSIMFKLISVFTSGFFSGFILTLSSFSWGLRWPIVSDLINKQIKSESRSTVISISNMVNYFGFTLFSPIFGYLVDIYDINFLYLIDGIMGLALVFTYFKIEVE
jgi:MFS family permease